MMPDFTTPDTIDGAEHDLTIAIDRLRLARKLLDNAGKERKAARLYRYTPANRLAANVAFVLAKERFFAASDAVIAARKRFNAARVERDNKKHTADVIHI